MKRLLILALAAFCSAVPAWANPASTAFTAAANSGPGHAAFDLDVDLTAGNESWRSAGMDVVPFYYEQGMAAGDGSLVFSSRRSLTRTSVGCSSECYAVRAESATPIPTDLAARGYNHLGGIDIGGGLVFAPLETDNPRTERAYGLYDLNTLGLVHVLVEQIPHRYNSWVAVDPSGRYMITGEDRWEPLRVYEVVGTGSDARLERRPLLDVTGATPSTLPNFQGCKFADALTLYCSNWNKRSSYFDVRSEVYRVSLTAPLGEQDVTASSSLAFSFEAHPKGEQVADNVPYGLETEDLAFWDGQLHVQIRGEGLGWVRILHFAPGS